MTLPTPSEKRQQIPFDSAEALWEWHIPSDRLFLSQGACQALELSEASAPATMTAFLAHIPPSCLPGLHEHREGVLNGTSGSFVETCYAFDTVLVSERLFVLKRDAQERAIWAMGHYAVSAFSTTPQQSFMSSGGPMEDPGTGYWHCTLPDRSVRLDACCATLLGYTDGQPHSIPLDDWKARIQDEECVEMDCRHRLILENPLLGDTISDRMRIQREDGSFVMMLLQGAVLERDATGKALYLAGSLQRADTTSSLKNQQNENGRLLYALNATGDGLWDWDAQTNSVYYSPRYLSMLGYTTEEFPGDLATWKTKIHPDDHDKIVYPQEAVVESPRFGDTFECTYRILRADETWGWILGRGYVTHRDANGRATRLVGMHTDVTTLQSGREELEALVKNDALTGLRSRSYCDMELERIERNNIRPISVISCDISGLKLINDYMGHAVGDRLLIRAAMMLRHPLRATDCVARTGGDEFVILLPGCTENAGNKILEQLETYFAEENAVSDMPVLVSFGIASTDRPDVPVSKVLINADKTMLRNKKLAHKQTHTQVKLWIEHHTQCPVSLEDDRCAC